MPVQPTYPGVYIEEIPSGVRTIVGVSTSITAFVGFFERGPMNEPVRIFNLGDFQRIFGGLSPRSEAGYAIQQFFLNGGSEALVVRTASGGVEEADVIILDGVGGGAATALTVTAINPGAWGNGLRAIVDPVPGSLERFNLTVQLFETRNDESVLLTTEAFPNLSMTATDPRFADRVVNDDFTGSRLVTAAASGTARPQLTGTLSGPLAAELTVGAATPEVMVTIGTEGTETATLTAAPTTRAEARGLLESAIRAARPASRAFAQARVSVVDDGRLRILAGPTEANAQVTFATVAGDPTADDLGLVPGESLDALVSGDLTGAFPHAGGQIRVDIGGNDQPLTLGAMADLDAAALELQTQIRAVDPAFVETRVAAHPGEQRLIVLASAAVSFSAQAPDLTTVDDLALGAGTAEQTNALGSLSADVTPSLPAAAGDVDITIGADGPHRAELTVGGANVVAVAADLENAIRAANPVSPPAFAQARAAGYQDAGENRLVVVGGVAGDTVVFAATGADLTTAGELGLVTPADVQANVQSYQLGAGLALAGTAQGAGTVGASGDPPNATDLIGDLAAKTGIFALEDADLFNLLVIPRATRVSGDDPLDPDPATALTQAAAIITAATNYCEDRRAFFLFDPPSGVDEVQEVQDWLAANDTLRHRNVAFYFPRVRIPDPLDNFRLRTVGASGTIAGLYARTDTNRGVWKAPAGTEAALVNVQAFEYVLSNAENGTLNPLAINALRNFPVFGNIAWGARTLDGSDQRASEWKYVPVRRLALFIEESLFRGTQWVVFEPNDEPLWAQIRLNVGAFMQNLFLQGAFQGSTPRQAYLVKCDGETTTQNDIDRGIVNIVVGFAPLKPAEFVIIQIQQLAGQIQA